MAESKKPQPTGGVRLEGAQAKLEGSLIGSRVGDTMIVSEIARGGMAVVYLGRQDFTNRQVAVKVLRPERQLSYRDREYFLREAQAMGQIRHPHLVELYSAGVTDDGRNYMIMEYVPGRTLRQIVEEEGPLEPLRCVRLFRQLLLALEAVHATGIVHRDLKPDNVLIETLEGGKKERLRLADLGLVKFIERKMPRLTGHGMTVGTPCYMSPEQVRGEGLDPRSDLYTIGVLMFEAVTSYLPYPEEKNVDGLLDHILDTPPAKLVRADRKFERFPGLQLLLDRLMAKAADRRPSNAAEVIHTFERLLETDLVGDVQAALEAHEEAEEVETIPEPEVPGQIIVQEGVLIAFTVRDRHSAEAVSAPPTLLRRLRTWLQEGEVRCAQRSASLATFGMQRTDKALRVVGGLPRLIEHVHDEFPQHTIGVGVAFGAFSVDEDDAPVEGVTLKRVHKLARHAKPGQVLIPRTEASTFGL